MKRILINVVVAAIAFAVGANLYAVPPGTDEEISNRLEPFGSVCRAGDDCGVAAAATNTGPLSGEQVYNQFCFACHATGVSGAPKLADVEAWAPRVSKGMDELMATTLNGINAMPPKGTCMDCSDDELKQAVDYMVEQSR